ncbi:MULTISPECIES: hypothetical protein [Leptolyngbya]|uniref:hypothetical protein n=1 Tax=Leptolyngbya TaxID=47251 RepID=UPI001688F5BF|nr:hypothetical protein [Leptolyngbya sp. FACHB-1624]MBD1857109.1 hypothetical protein [Leptolyngbya sp. FACHB-1624]
MKQPHSIILTLTIITITIATPTLSEPYNSNPDRQGNYFSNEAPVKGTVQSPLMRGSLWQVTVSYLNCRSNADAKSRIIRQFKRSELLQADVGRGGADEVLLNAKDKNGSPWMRVRSASGQNYKCYVRANRRYIQPYSSHQ